MEGLMITQIMIILLLVFLQVFRLNSYVGGFGIVVIIFEALFLCFTLYFLYKMTKDIIKQRLKYFQDFWNLMEFATICLSLGAIVMYAIKKVFAAVAINTLKESCSGKLA
jgi:O-antigen/teichoic acid export membrane protein